MCIPLCAFFNIHEDISQICSLEVIKETLFLGGIFFQFLKTINVGLELGLQ
jgi:hypothetical protein